MGEKMTSSENQRYSRQIRYREIGEAGQNRILQGRVAVVGCGGLGSAQAEALARAGVGFIRVIDRDCIELSNLQRQLLFDEHDAEAASPKAIAAAERMRAINSEIKVEPVIADLTPSNADELLADVHLILDGTDNFETRYLVNDFAISRGLPWIYGAAVGSYGLKMPVLPGRTCCLRCVFPKPPTGVQPNSETVGILGPVTMTIGALQAADALKILAGHMDSVAAQITIIDVWTGEILQTPQPAPRLDCPACGRHEFEYLEGKTGPPIILCGQNAVQIHDRTRHVDLRQLATQLEAVGTVQATDFALRVPIAPYELTVFPDGRAIIKGTTDVGIARSLYAKYIGN
jgi:adenylyltransferase/sulfurtransferase